MIKALLIDLDGTLYVGERPIPGAREALSWLTSRGYRRLFVTNTTTKTREALAEKLRKMGFAISEEEILSALEVTYHFLKGKGRPSCHLLLREEVKGRFAEFPEGEEAADFVVVGDIGDRWDYLLLNRAFRTLFAGAELLAAHKNRFWQTEEGLRIDIGPFVAALEYASGKEAIVCGKPSLTFFKTALDLLGLPPEEVAMVGDDVEMDVGGAQKAGIKGILVRTGKFREAFLKRCPVRPDAIIDSIAALPELLEQLNSGRGDFESPSAGKPRGSGP